MTAAKEPAAFSWDGEQLRIRVRVQPRSSHNAIEGLRDGRLRIRTTAAPTDGKANKAVVRLLADYLDVAPSRIRLLHGSAHRNKLFVVEGAVKLPFEL